MNRTYNVQITKPIKLMLLLILSIGVFFATTFFLKIFDFKVIAVIAGLILSIASFIILKQFTIQKLNFTLTKKEIDLGGQLIAIEDIKSFKTHRMRGGSLKLKLMSGKIIRISSNSNFCDTLEFERFLNDFEKKVHENKDILKVKSFGETKVGLYTAIFFTMIFIGILLYELIAGNNNLSTQRILIIAVALTSFWSGIKIKNVC